MRYGGPLRRHMVVIKDVVRLVYVDVILSSVQAPFLCQTGPCGLVTEPTQSDAR